MKMKFCFKCRRNRALSMFYKHPMMGDGYLGKCKSCAKKDVTENRRKRLKQYSDYEKQRYKRPERRAQLTRYTRNRRRLYPGKYRAVLAVSNAIRDGRLKRMPCEVCGNPKSQGHHDDYRKKLSVRWLCFKHHREVAHGQTVVVEQ